MPSPKKIEKILSYRVLLLINVLIIIATELSGRVFLETGIIHLIAIIFVILGISRIFFHYDAYDRYLHLLIMGGSLALVIFSASHVVEFLGYVFFKTYEDSIFASVINFYIASMLAITIGAERFLRVLKKGSAVTIGILGVAMVAFLFLPVLIFSEKLQISLEPDELTPYVYAVLVLGVSALSISHLLEIKKHVSIMGSFVNHFILAFLLITISAFDYIFYDVIQTLGVPNFQVVYISHFLFYGAMTLMFLAFVRLSNLGGIYQEVERSRDGRTSS